MSWGKILKIIHGVRPFALFAIKISLPDTFSKSFCFYKKEGR